jgi:hypothetical protein
VALRQGVQAAVLVSLALENAVYELRGVNADLLQARRDAGSKKQATTPPTASRIRVTRSTKQRRSRTGFGQNRLAPNPECHNP